jgi:hypothetical protein
VKDRRSLYPCVTRVRSKDFRKSKDRWSNDYRPCQTKKLPAVVATIYARIVISARDSNRDQIAKLLDDSVGLFSPSCVSHSAAMAVTFATLCSVQVLAPIPISDDAVDEFVLLVSEAEGLFPTSPSQTELRAWLR